MKLYVCDISLLFLLYMVDEVYLVVFDGSDDFV